MEWHKQAGNITTNHTYRVYFTLPSLSVTDVVKFNFHLDDPNKGRCGMILVIDLLTELWLNLKLSEHVIEADDGNFKGCITTMIDLSTYIFKYLNTEKITPE